MNGNDLHGVVLLVICSDLTMVGITGVLDENTILTDAAAEGSLDGSQAMLMRSHDVTVGARLGGLETKSVEKIDVGLGAMTLVVGVANDVDLAQSHRLNEVFLRGENGIHGDWVKNVR